MHYLDRNEFQFELPRRCTEVVQNSSQFLLTHYSRSFERNTKSPVTERLSEIVHIPEENILLGYGCEDLLTQLVQHFVKKGDKILVAEYAWWYYKKIAEQMDGVTLEFPVHKSEVAFYIDVDNILSMYEQHHPRLILLANPNNPTGDSVPIEDIENISRRCQDSIMIIDESYWGYHDQGNEHLSRFLNSYPNIVILRTFSKFYGLAGVRIGFGFVHSQHNRLIRCSHRYLGFNRLSEEMALVAMDSFEHYAAIGRVVEKEKARYYSEIRRLPGVQVYDSKANFILVSAPENTIPAIKNHFKKADIAVRFFENGGLKNHFRISIAKPEINDLVFQCLKDTFSSL